MTLVQILHTIYCFPLFSFFSHLLLKVIRLLSCILSEDNILFIVSFRLFDRASLGTWNVIEIKKVGGRDDRAKQRSDTNKRRNNQTTTRNKESNVLSRIWLHTKVTPFTINGLLTILTLGIIHPVYRSARPGHGRISHVRLVTKKETNWLPCIIN